MGDEMEFLRTNPYFSGIALPELDSISKLMFKRTAGRGETILLEDEPAEALFFVASGVVKVFKTSADGKEQILYLLRPGESLNDAPAFDGGPNPASAQALGPVVLYGIKRGDLEVILREHPKVALNVTRVLSQRVRHLMSLVEDLSFKHVMGRLAKILLEQSGDKTGNRPWLTQQDMAAMAGTAREMIGRSLKALEDDGAIRLEGRRIVITDKKALEELAR